METGALLSRAWMITRRYSWLWIIGLFLTGMASGNVDLTLPGGSNVTGVAAGALSIPAVMGVVFVAGVLAVAGVALWVVGALARGALIVAVDRIEAADTAADVPAFSLAESLAAGVEHFGRLFLIGIPVSIPALLLTFVAYAGALAGLVGDAGTRGMNRMLALLLALCSALVVMSIVLTLVQHFADRAAVLEGLTPLAAYRRGWTLLWHHRDDLRGVGVFWVALTIGLRLLLALPTTTLMLPILFAGIAGQPLDTPALAVLGIAGFVSVMVTLLFAVGNVLTSTLWTLVYRACLVAEQAGDATTDAGLDSNEGGVVVQPAVQQQQMI